MPTLERLTISDNISARYARARIVVYSALGLGFVAFAAFLNHIQPSFLMLAATCMFFCLGALFFISRNPLGMLTLRTQQKMAVREIISAPDGLTIMSHGGEATQFKAPRVELTSLPAPGGCDYYLLLKDEDGPGAIYYLSSDQLEVDMATRLLEENSTLIQLKKTLKPQ